MLDYTLCAHQIGELFHFSEEVRNIEHLEISLFRDVFKTQPFEGISGERSEFLISSLLLARFTFNASDRTHGSVPKVLLDCTLPQTNVF
jgi:hypothetical protein